MSEAGGRAATDGLMPVNMLWVGGSLGPIERLSLTSFLAHGHPVRLHVYDSVGAVPAGVEVRDGNDILPFETVAANRYANGSYALASNFFRYALQKRGMGIWADADVVCLRPIHIDLPVIVGWESDDSLNGAVLYFRADLPIVEEAVSLFRPDYIPDWLPLRKGVPARIKGLLGGSFGPRDLPHGTFGPKAVTALVRRHGLLGQAQPPEIFYPLRPKQARRVFDASLKLADIAKDRSLTIHLWNEKLGPLKKSRPEPGSLLDELYERHGI